MPVCRVWTVRSRNPSWMPRTKRALTPNPRAATSKSQLTWSERNRTKGDSFMNNTLAHTGNQPVNRLHGIDSGLTATKGETSTTEESSHSTTLSQRLAICFAAGVIGALAVLLFSHVLSWFGPGPKGPIPFPASFEPPGIYRPLFWGGLWGLLFGFFIKPVWNRLYLVGLLYFLVPMAA